MQALKAVRLICNNCGERITGWQDESGRTKVQCPKCGSVTVSMVKSRRHVQIDMYAPKGQIVDNEIYN